MPPQIDISSPAATQDAASARVVENSNGAQASGLPVLTGWSLWIVVLSLCGGLLLSTLETTIIATALVTISSDLGHFERSSWVVLAYLITYTGFLIIVSRMSDIFGRKQVLLASIGMFTIFSAACGWSQSMEQLIVFRALQGIGGSGLYALAISVVPEITPLERLGHASGAISAVSACSSVLGPIIGGVITSHTTWRWVFWLNIPVGVIVMAFVFWIFPQNINQERHSMAMYKMIDWPGAILSLVGSVTLTFALESGGIEFPWKSTAIISSFVIAGVSWVLFPLWETYLTSKAPKVNMLPIFPAARFVRHRVIAASLATGFFTGFPFTAVVITLPQRFQIVNGLSPVEAGIRMLPLLLLTALGAGIAGFACSKKNISFIFLLSSSLLYLLCTALLSILPTTLTISYWQYGIQVILGFSFGVGLVSLIIITRVEVEAEDHAVAMGAITQIRVLGGIIGLSIIQAVLIASLKTMLVDVLDPAQLAAVLASVASIRELEPSLETLTRRVYGEAVNRQMRVVMGFAAASVVASAFAWRRRPIQFKDLLYQRPDGAANGGESVAVELAGGSDNNGGEIRGGDSVGQGVLPDLELAKDEIQGQAKIVREVWETHK